MPRLGVTRDSEQLVALYRKAIERNIEIIPLPFLSIKPLPFSFPANNPLNKIDWLLFTSANGVHSFYKQLSSAERDSFRGKIATVGFKTEAALLDYDLKADFIPQEAYGEILFDAMASQFELHDKTIAYVRAKEVRFDPKEFFTSQAGSYVEIISYESITNKLTPNKVAGFTETDHILFTAPSTVKAYNHQFHKPKAKTIAIGNSTAEEMIEVGWKVDILMKKPDIVQVLEYI